MRKAVFLIVLVACVGSLQAQKNNRTSAFNYHRNGNLEKAKEFIDKATEHEQTINDARTWFYAGNIYLDIRRSLDENYRKLDSDALNKAYNAYVKSMKYDEKNEYTGEVLERLKLIGEEFFNEGANNYNKGVEMKTSGDASELAMSRSQFRSAVESFKKAIEVFAKTDVIDTISYLYAAHSYEQAGDTANARPFFEKLVNELDYKTPMIYNSLFHIYYQFDKDTLKALDFVLEGRELFPGDLALLYNETNVYLGKGDTEKALSNLNVAMELDKTNPTIYFAVGSLIDKQIVSDTTKPEAVREDAFRQAIDTYEKTIELDSNYFDAIYNLGAIYVNKAVGIYNYANQLGWDQNEEFEKLTKEADELIGLSLPYLEKAHEMQESDRSTMIALREIYTRLKMYENLKEINEKISDL